MKEINVKEHELVPEHIKLNKEETQELLKKYNISLKQLPSIKAKDKAIQHLNPEKGDIIKIIRKSQITGTSIFYRGVV